MRGLGMLAAFAVIVVVLVATVAADSPLTLEHRVATLEALHGIDRSTPTPTLEPTPTNTPQPTATSTPAPTATPTLEPTATSEPQGCNVPDGASIWHPPTDHEHGDVPPQWADDWSCEQFGHPVVFGGDEATPGEDEHKHNAYKGFSWSFILNGQPVDAYVRVHAQTNPHGRIARYHSAEMYFRTGADVSLMQFWSDFGEDRFSFADVGIFSAEVMAVQPKNFIIGHGDGENSGHDPAWTGLEFWYAQVSSPGGWTPTILLDYQDPTVYVEPDEHLAPLDMETWNLTGDYGLDRHIMIRWVPAGWQTGDEPRGWFCATPLGVITSTGSSACAPGELPQHIAPSLPLMNGLQGKSAVWPCPACVLPN